MKIRYVKDLPEPEWRQMLWEKVTKIEGDVSGLRLWKSKVVGGMAVITVVMIPLVVQLIV